MKKTRPRHSRIIRSFCYMLSLSITALALCILLYGLAAFAIALQGERLIRTALHDAGIEASFNLTPAGLTKWHMRQVKLKQRETIIELDQATLEIHPFNLAYKPGSLTLGPVNITLPDDAGVIHIESISFTPNKLADTGMIDINIPSIEHISKTKRYFMPAQAQARVAYHLPSEQAAFTYRITEGSGHWELHGKGHYRWAEESHWSFTYQLPTITFEPGVLQPDQLSPALAGLLKSVRGSVGASGEMAQTAKDTKRTETLTLKINSIDANINDIPIRQLNGTLHFNSLFPLQTKGSQSLNVREVIVGIPLSEGKIAFKLIKNTQLSVSSTRWNWGGGQIATEPFFVDLAHMNLGKMQLNAQAILLEKLLISLLEKGINATGKLSGTVPMQFKGGNPFITGGKLATEEGGVVHYKPEDSPLSQGGNPQVALLMQALENFEYEYLRLNIDSIDADNVNVKLSTRGKNPDLYGGQVIELNVNLTGNLWDLARSSTQAMGIGKRIEEKLSK